MHPLSEPSSLKQILGHLFWGGGGRADKKGFDIKHVYFVVRRGFLKCLNHERHSKQRTPKETRIFESNFVSGFGIQPKCSDCT